MEVEERFLAGLGKAASYSFLMGRLVMSGSAARRRGGLRGSPGATMRRLMDAIPGWRSTRSWD
jgi:hypothetical protein